MHNSIVIKPSIQKMLGFFFAAFTAVSLLMGSAVQVHAATTNIWPALRESLFAGRSVEDGASFIHLAVPTAAENPALVPLSFKINRPDIRQAWLLIDGNPVPLTATFHIVEAQPSLAFEVRVRLERSTWVRLVAETDAGALYMATVEIKTPGGGCGGGLDGDEAKLRATAGQMKLQPDTPFVTDAPGQMTYLLRHPMRTGFERTTQGYYAKPWFIQRLDFSQNGKPFLGIDLGVGMSSDPRIRFSYMPSIPAVISVIARDNEGLEFQQQFHLENSTTGDKP